MAKENEALLSRIFKRYFINALGSMAYGLFASLIVGTILSQFASIEALSFLAPISSALQSKPVYGAAIAIAIAWGLKADALVVFSCAGAGAAGCIAGGPVGAFVAALIGAELGQLVSKKTPLDIVVTPIVAVVTGGLAGVWVGPYIDASMSWLGNLINMSMELVPLPMGIAVGIIVGVVLTLPISSAALCIMLGLTGLAGGSACAGCCAQMIGFAVISYGDNGFSGLISQGVGTSMLQVPNILRKPQIWIAPTVASGVAGALSATVFQMETTSIGAGMGTSGLVGQIATYATMAPTHGGAATLFAILAVQILIPALCALAVDNLLRRIGWVKKGDMKLQKI